MKESKDIVNLRSYCSIHNIYPEEGKPCHQCALIYSKEGYRMGYKDCAKHVRSMIQSLVKSD